MPGRVFSGQVRAGHVVTIPMSYGEVNAGDSLLMPSRMRSREMYAR